MEIKTTKEIFKLDDTPKNFKTYQEWIDFIDIKWVKIDDIIIILKELENKFEQFNSRKIIITKLIDELSQSKK